ncbi:riboflavin kinase [Kwoniella mangroviensis CBS 10435]|uniref:Riboflavin kinase n=1 Tax=Kwoniella mangroviensis CBS 10435 TaxID=1331196 RepID=A0A1B9IMB3_9TREE|nr:riboflavin kinase [Kwoniella mangroviensis CBS 8507]OCF56647.1 riboflavin kinase [Kwoniella mangroviensis CBS 10435]OCF65382.1 riboflavin kinase [Kwoniella mangroviensis CBS 8507]OCF75220.1 riboflavin kinase [Kwoniella mangroviensis CBS 8886]
MAAQAPAPAPPNAPMAPVSRSSRPTIVGPDQPEHPYPMKLEGTVTKGFGRGARFLGIPTANLPDTSLDPLNALNMTGIYYGFARIHPSSSTPLPSTYPTPIHSGPSSPSLKPTKPPNLDTHELSKEALESIPTITAPYPPEQHAQRWSKEDEKIWPMVMSVGWNPYFKNEKITAEVHIMHPFKADFYGHHMSVLVLGYIRPELDYVSKEALIEDIQTDVKVALNSLARSEYAKYAENLFLTKDRL